MKTVLELPFNRHIGLEAADEPNRLLRLPAGERFHNHLGTVHASAQLALAEASSGEYLLRELGDIAGLFAVVRRLEATFRQPAQGAITSRAKGTPEEMARVRTTLSTKGRALIAIGVEVHDEQGAHTLAASIEWFLQLAGADGAPPAA